MFSCPFKLPRPPPQKYNVLTTLGPAGLNCVSHRVMAYPRSEARVQQFSSRNQETPASPRPQKSSISGLGEESGPMNPTRLS